MGLIGLSACAQLPPSPGVARAPSLSQSCAKISWRDMSAARDINAAIFTRKDDAALTRLAYGPVSGLQPSSEEPAELDRPLRSEQSLQLSEEFRREHEKAQLREVEHWVQAHLTVEVRSCPAK